MGGLMTEAPGLQLLLEKPREARPNMPVARDFVAARDFVVVVPPSRDSRSVMRAIASSSKCSRRDCAIFTSASPS